MVTKVSDTVADFCWEGVFQHINDTTGLGFRVSGGMTSDNVNWFTVPETLVTLEDNAVNTVALYYETGVIDITSNDAGNFNYTTLYEVTTAAGAITTIVDKRTHHTARKIIPQVGDLIIDDFTLQMASMLPDIWLSPDSSDLIKGWTRNLGNDSSVAKLYPDLANYGIETIGPGAPSLNSAMRFKWGTGTGKPVTSCWNLPHRMLEDSAKSSTLDDNRRGALFINFKIDTDDLAASGSHYLYSVQDANTQTLWQWMAVNPDGSIQFTGRTDSGATYLIKSTTGLITDDSWHSIYVRRNGGVGVDADIYLDGTLVTDAGLSSANRDGWWLRVNSDGYDHTNVPGAFYGFSSTGSITRQGVNTVGPTIDKDIIVSTWAWWVNSCPTESSFSTLHTLTSG